MSKEFQRRKATTNEQVSVPPDGFYVCGCGSCLWILVKNGDCVCSACNRAQARIKVSELAPVDTRWYGGEVNQDAVNTLAKLKRAADEKDEAPIDLLETLKQLMSKPDETNGAPNG